MQLKLRYDSPAPDSAEGWENYSLPLGNSYLGVNVFGGVEKERLQVTENSLENDYDRGGLNNFAEISMSFPHTFEKVSEYERGLSLNDGIAFVRYKADGMYVEREYFASYPDRVFVGRVRTSATLNYEITVQVPHINDAPDRGKTGEVIALEDTIILRGMMRLFHIRFEGRLRVISDGCVTSRDGKLYITEATDTLFLFCGATNYELRPEVFYEKDFKKKLRDFDPHELVYGIMERASAYSYDTLKERHTADFAPIFARVALDLGETEVPSCTTDKLLKAYSEGEKSRYLEALYFQYGRYLLLSSSREGCLPANLQGVWNCHDFSPWGSGYWHNINVQMNYWPAFVSNLAETFPAFRDFCYAYRAEAEEHAARHIRTYVPENYTDEPGECGWTVDGACYAYLIDYGGSHSGPGTGGLTTKLFWDYYAFTGDETILREYTYPTLLSMAKFFSRCVRDYDGLYLSAFSASPEQIIANCENDFQAGRIQYHHTIGCAFDQQMIWENAHDLLRCVEILGEETLPEKDRNIIQCVREQIARYDPVQIGWSGQIKEFREEKFYGEIGEYRHRHISHLVGLYPGTLISRDTPAWLDAAKVSLNFRSDESTGWALAHRLNAWARTGDGNRTYKLFSSLLSSRTMPNLWDTHPPFQIDGNFGGTAGVTEMLLQSHEKCIYPLACLPDEWADGAYNGLVARGGFIFGVQWRNGCATDISIHSTAGNVCRIKYPGITHARMDFAFTVIAEDIIEFATETGCSYTIVAIPPWEKREHPTEIKANRQLELQWSFPEPVNVWRAIDSAPAYELLATNVFGGTYTDSGLIFSDVETVTYKITRADTMDSASVGAVVTLNHSTQLEREHYRAWIRQLNLVCGHASAADYLGE